MSPPHTLSGRLPLMRVRQQLPQEDHDRRADPVKFRLRLHTFVDSRSFSVPTTAVPPAYNGVSPKPPSAYKRIAFTAAKVPGQPNPSNEIESSDSLKRKKRRTAQNLEKTRLRAIKPLSASLDMHADAWSIILAHTRPAFVMQMRTVSRFFYHITNTDTIWRDAREHHFGADLPPRPSYLTERQYASLLDGRGCQNPRCERRETRKVRWVFRLRLCDDCLSRKLDFYKNDDGSSPQSRYASLFETTEDQEQYGTSIVDLLPASSSWSGKPNAPRDLSDSGKWAPRPFTASPLLYLKSDYAALEQEYKKIEEEDWEPGRVFEWVQEKYCNATMIARTAFELEWWECTRDYNNSSSSSSSSSSNSNNSNNSNRLGSIRTQRQHYFVQKALKLSPRMTKEVLSCFAAYHAALATSNPPSERAWETLLEKIQPFRSLAEGVVRYANARYTRFGQLSTPSLEMACFNKLHQHRKSKRREIGKWSPEQQFVIDLAEQEFGRLIDEVADEDLLLMCLRNVYTAYQRLSTKPEGLNLDGKFGKYRLSLDDAKLIVEEVIEKRIRKSTLRGVKVLESLRCMGCTRFTTGKRHSFQSAFEHMLEKHSRLVGKDLHFHRFLKYSRVPSDCLSKDYKFPWYLVEWTRSLPLLPTHAEIVSETRWIPDEDVPYRQLNKPSTRSAFDGRHAVRLAGKLPDDFVTHFIHVVQTLSTTRLDSECVVKIAIRYGTDVSITGNASIEDFFACVKAAQELRSGLQFKFRCGACNRRPEVNSHLRCVKYPVEVNVLRKHWDDKHAQENIDWTTNFMDLPSDTALLEIMLTQDEKLRQDQANSIKRETVGLKKDARKVPDQKANALMHKEMALEAFARLFANTD